MQQINDLIDIKYKNIKAIVNEIRFTTQTKKHIATTTNLSVATVSNLCNELKNMNVLSEYKIEEKRIGRIPSTIMLNYDDYYILALDFQLENLLGIAMLNLKNDIVYEQLSDISQLSSAREVIDFAKNALNMYMDASFDGKCNIIGVGAAVPASFDINTDMLVFSAISQYEGAPLSKMLEEAFSVPAYVDNLTNIDALSVSTSYPDMKNIVCMNISQGVGVGIIAEGSLLRGKNGYATEIAHIPLGNPTLRCPICGNFGCIENELSINGMISLMPDIPTSLPLTERWNRFVEEMKTENEFTEDIARNIGSLAGKLASVLVNIFDSETLYISGYIRDIFYRIAPYFKTEFDARCSVALSKGLKIIVDNADTRRSNIFTALSDIVYNLWNPLK